jgi:hypothetical protein
MFQSRSARESGKLIPKAPRSAVLSFEEGAIVLLRKYTVLPLDDCFYALRATIKFAFAQLHPTANVKTAVNFATALIKAVPYRTYTLSSPNNAQAPAPATGCTRSIVSMTLIAKSKSTWPHFSTHAISPSD